MSLKYKVIIALMTVFIVFGAIEYGVQQFVIIPEFVLLEEKAAIKDTKRVIKAIQRELHHLNLLCFDWAAWDDTYSFVSSASEKYILANLGYNTFTGNHINLICFFNPNKKMVWGKAYDLNTAEEIELAELNPDQSFEKKVFSKLDFQNPKKPEIFLTGLLITGKGPLLIAARPILTTSYEGETNGMLIMGKLLNASMIEVLKNQTEVNFSVERINPQNISPNHSHTIEKINADNGYLVDRSKDTSVVVKSLLTDLFGNPGVLFRAEFSKTLSLEGKRATRVALISFTASAFLTLLAGLTILQIFALEPIVALNRHALSIAQGKKIFKSLIFKRKDEIGELSQSIDKMKDHLLSMNEKLQAIIDSMPLGLVCMNTDGDIVLINETAVESFRNESIEIYGQKIWDVLPETVLLKEELKKSIETGQVVRFNRQQVDLKEKKIHCDITIYPLNILENNEAVVLIQDVTKLVLMEQAAVKSDKMTSIAGLAAGMAHEINNPLYGIIQNAQLIKTRLAQPLPANEKLCLEMGISPEALKTYAEKRGVLKSLDHIQNSSEQASNIVKNILSFSQNQSGNKAPHHVSELVNAALELAKLEFKMKKEYDFQRITIINEAITDCEVVCEKNTIIQALFNIIKNAAEALHTQKPENQEPEIRIQFQKIKDKGQITIKDNGPGLSPSLQKRIFDPFFTTKDPDQGTGLGLSLCYYIVVADHGGELEVQSSDNDGAAFHIRLPLS